MTITPGSGPQLHHDDIRQGAILMAPGEENLRCQVDRIDGPSVHMRVLDNKTYDDKREFTMTINDVIAGNWQLTRKAA